MASLNGGPTLPSDVLGLVVQHLPGSDLKQARLLSRAFDEVCAKQLFRSIVLVPMTSCLTRFAALLKSGSVGRHIRKVTYDDRWHHMLWDFVRILVPRPLTTYTTAECLIAKYHDKETIAHDPDREAQLLADVFSLVPALKEVELIGQWKSCDEDEELPEFFSSFLKEIIHGRDINDEAEDELGDSDGCSFPRNAAATLLRAMPQDSPACQILKIQNINTVVMSRKPAQGATTCALSALHELDLAFVMPAPALWTEDYAESEHGGLAVVLTDAIRHASDLKRLRLKGLTRPGGPGTYCDGRETVIKNLVQAGSAFKSLRSLSVQGAPMDEGYLSKFLQQHQGILKELDLKNIIMVHNRNEPRYECLVQLLRSIKAMRLKHFSFGGVVANGGSQIWHFEGGYDFGSELKEFLNNRNESFHRSLNFWGCGGPGYGCLVGGRSYPCTIGSRWFDRNAVSTIEQWVLDQGSEETCPMEQFAIPSGQLDYESKVGERTGWHAYVWSADEWAFRYGGEYVKY